MRLLLPLAVLLALAFPAGATSGSPSSSGAGLVWAFYYPWYGTPAVDGQWEHWNQDGHDPPDDIASSYYPAQGLYSSSDEAVVAQQMQEIKASGIDGIVYSWWGRGSREDSRLPMVLSIAREYGVAVAAHIEPYRGRTVASVVEDVAYLRTLGISTFFIYQTFDQPVDQWAAAQAALHAGGTTLFAQTDLAGEAAAAGFDGVYTYDIVTYGGNELGRLCQDARREHLLCAPSVGPGFDARRGDGDPRLKPRRNGHTYDAMWGSAIAAHPDEVTITSFNEWHEGTQIEPAAPPSRHGEYRYLSYDGAWGLYGTAAEDAYLQRTLYWSNVFRSTFASQEKMRHS